ncbi:MAG: FMN-binding protein, partial [Clostridia bacterium]|nr:FMN-binding protein [Clostridia bacterium]
MKKKLPAFLILAIIALVAALALALTNSLTEGPIQERAQAALRAARQVVLPADTFEEAQSSDEAVAVHVGKANGEAIGYTGVVTVTGYAGPVEVILGTDNQGKITGISVGGANFAETAGLGSKAKEPGFTDQFKDKTLPVALGANIDAIGGATITSRAVVNGVNQAGTAIAAAAGFELGEAPAAPVEEEVEIGAVAAGTMTGESQGFQSSVKATVTVGADGLISEVVIASADETEGFGTKLDGNADFASQFVGKMGPFAIGEGIDALSGATVTSEAAVKAINQALVNGPEAPKPAAGTATGESQGFQSTVKATVTVGDDGLVSEVVIASADETEGFGTKLHENAEFAAQFVGKAAPFKAGEGVDVLTGATVTSKAVIEAVNNAVSSLAAPAGQTAEGESQGFQSVVKATITVGEDGLVSSVVITSDGETEGFGTKLHENADFAS